VSISIKDVDENSFRNLKAEAVRRSIKVGQAASEAFRMWVALSRQHKVRDVEKMRGAAQDMDILRGESKAQWPGVAEIRKWRDKRK
jgi:hypothetical protein